MHKRKLIMLAIFSTFVFCSIIYHLQSVFGIHYTVLDVEDDVLRECDPALGIEILDTGNYHDEIDITELAISGQYVNLTVAGNLASWNSSYRGLVLLSSNIITDAFNNLACDTPRYVIDWTNENGHFEVAIEKAYHAGGYNYSFEVWNGTGWEDKATATPFNIAFDITTHTVISYIPDAVEEIPSDMKVIGKTSINLYYYDYSDITRIPSSDNGIPSYNLFILIGSMMGISLILLKKKK